MSEMKKTILCDIDGCLFKHKGNMSMQYFDPELLPGTIEKLNEWDAAGYKIILITGRKESMRKITENQLEIFGIFYDQLIMGVNRGERIIINDMKPNSDTPMARSINIMRNEGIKDITI